MFAILRTKKLGTMGNIGASASHNYRERRTDNADPTRAAQNTHLKCHSADELKGAVAALLPEKRRKNAVLAIEYLVTASPEAFKRSDFDEKRYFEDAIRWLEAKHGKNCVVAASIHRDEMTPHLAAFVVPLVDGKLRAGEFLDGRVKMRQLQSEFADQVGKAHGLQRGIEGSKATHQRVAQHYGAIARELEEARALPKRPKAPAPRTLGERLPFSDDKRRKDAEEASFVESMARYKREFALAQKQRGDLFRQYQLAAMTSKGSAKRLKELQRTLADKDAHIAKLGVSIEALKAENEQLKAQVEALTDEKKTLYRQLGKMIKAAYTPDQLAAELGVQLAGKADVFDVLVKSGRARDFYGAVDLVARHYERKDGRPLFDVPGLMQDRLSSDSDARERILDQIKTGRRDRGGMSMR